MAAAQPASAGARLIAVPQPRSRAQQVAVALESLRRLDSAAPLAKYEALVSMLYTDPDLFFHVALRHTALVMPLIYTPLVGAACTNWSHLSAPYKGLYISLNDAGRVAELLRAWPQPAVKAIVVTDGERILGLGDLGANGMGIPVGKLALYSALAGVDPRTTLPITIDAGTNNKANLADTDYIGLRRERDHGPAYHALIAEFVAGVRAVFGEDCLVQWEDFGNSTAFVHLTRYRDVVPSFNDDIQGTASVVLGGLLSAATHVDGVAKLEDSTILFQGAGEAGVGTAELISYAIQRITGKSLAEARSRVWLVDTKGLITAERLAAEGDAMAHHKQAYAHPAPPADETAGADAADFVSAVRRLKPNVIIGVSAQAGAFSESVVREMARVNRRPVIFALSNPTEKAECTAEQALKWSGGSAVFASGSPFDPLTVDLGGGKTLDYTPGQGNNAYIFPALGLATIAVRMKSLPDSSFYVAAVALAAQVTKAAVDKTGCIYPDLKDIRSVSAAIAIAVAEDAYAQGLARAPRPDDLDKFVRSFIWSPSS